MALVISIRAKHSVQERQHFVQTLPSLMAGLQKGMEDIAWPRAARHAFFGELVALHTNSLKAVPGSELDRNMTVRQLETAFKTPLPRPDDSVDIIEEPGVVSPDGALAEQRFSPDEERAIGLVSQEEVELLAPLGPVARTGAAAADEAPAGKGSRHAGPASFDTFGAPGDPAAGALPKVDAGLLPDAARTPGTRAVRNTPTESANAPVFPTGSELREQLQLGFPYLLNLKGRMAEGAPDLHQPGAQPLPLFARRQGARSGIDDGPDLRSPLRGQADASIRDLLPRRTIDRAPACNSPRWARCRGRLPLEISDCVLDASARQSSATKAAIGGSAHSHDCTARGRTKSNESVW